MVKFNLRYLRKIFSDPVLYHLSKFTDYISFTRLCIALNLKVKNLMVSRAKNNNAKQLYFQHCQCDTYFEDKLECEYCGSLHCDECSKYGLYFFGQNVYYCNTCRWFALNNILNSCQICKFNVTNNKNDKYIECYKCHKYGFEDCCFTKCFKCKNYTCVYCQCMHNA